MTSNAIDMKSLTATKDRFMDEMRAEVKDAEAILKATTNQAGEEAVAARARIEKSLQIVKDRLIDAEEAALLHTKHAMKATDKYVNDNPWKAITITACAGVIVGMLIARR